MARQEQDYGTQGRPSRSGSPDVGHGVDDGQNIFPLTNLKILSIQSNRIGKIEGLDQLANLEELYISHNALTEISGLDHNVRD